MKMYKASINFMINYKKFLNEQCNKHHKKSFRHNHKLFLN